MRKIKFIIEGAQGFNNELSSKHNTVFVKAVSKVGISKEFLGAIMMIKYKAEEGFDYVEFILEDVLLTNTSDNEFSYLLKLSFVAKSEDFFIKINSMENTTLLLDPNYLTLD